MLSTYRPPALERKRGVVTLTETILTVAIGLGLFIGGLQIFRAAQASTDFVDRSRAAITLSAEIREQGRTLVSFDDLPGDTAQPVPEAAAGSPGIKTYGVYKASSLVSPLFNNVELHTSGQLFYVYLYNLNEIVCRKLLDGDVGPNGTAAEGDVYGSGSCASGDLTITYTR